MTVKTLITDPSTGIQASVTQDKELLMTNTGCPPLLKQKNRIFRQYLTDDGIATGSNDMSIDGSTINQEFYLKADDDDDRYITKLNFLVGYGATGKLYDWADSGSPLTNGCQLYYQTDEKTVYIHDAIKTNSDLIRLSIFDVFPTAWEIRNLGDINDYGYLITICFFNMMPPYGIKLDRGTNQKFVFKIRDDVTDADTFNCIAYGFDRFE